MDTNLLRNWLGLPPGPWPPDDCSLLGVSPNAIDSRDLERRVLERMNRLRPHQIMHPELVTEGMNRLAQALISLTTHRPEIPAPAPVAPPPPPPVAPPKAKVEAPPKAPSAFDFQPTPTIEVSPTPAVVPQTPEVIPEPSPVVQEAIPVKAVVETIPLAPLPPEPVRARPVRAPLPEPIIPDVEDEQLDDVAIPVGLHRSGRRMIVAEVVALRTLGRSLQRLRSFLADPAEMLTTPGRICAYLEAIEQFRSAIEHPGLEDEVDVLLGFRLERVMNTPLPLSVYRSLTRHQRERLARDWARAMGRVDHRRQYLRRYLRTTRRATLSQQWHALNRRLVRQPEWLMAGSMAMVLAIVAVRWVAR